MSICSLNAVLMEIFALISLDSLKISLFGAVAVFFMKFQLNLVDMTNIWQASRNLSISS